ncbi:MAG: PilZ domain-containing protein [Halomonas sp.]|uniref:PilZ domain-containing protein n=1 Tax=Halomonas TaxID=2745 RepID=UPI0004800831|nr:MULTISPECIES: PilZ domain-containing protein [Halomonas]NWN81446.1 PilZ domain-containing protein [Halomonas sp.]
MVAPQALSLTIEDTQALFAAYMPALERGGIFVPTRERHELGQQIHLLLVLPGDSDAIPVTGEVIWVTPDGASGGRPPGVGIHFSTADSLTRDRIERLLAGHPDDGTPTHTL